MGSAAAPPPDRPKYALPERERRWLVAPSNAAALVAGPPTRIRDHYLEPGRLRLRCAVSSTGATVHKLGKKYGDRPAGDESITNLYLTAAEFDLLAALPGWIVDKQRYRVGPGALDRYGDGDDAAWIFELDFEDAAAAAACPHPAFADREVTGDPLWTGAALARRFGRRQPAAPAADGLSGAGRLV